MYLWACTRNDEGKSTKPQYHILAVKGIKIAPLEVRSIKEMEHETCIMFVANKEVAFNSKHKRCQSGKSL